MTEAPVAVPCSVIRGGTSRGVYFQRGDLPSSPADRDRVLLTVMGGPDELRVDGLAGAHPLTSKVAVVNRSDRAGVDVDYLFLQVDPAGSRVSESQNCGNLLAGVGAFAIEEGLVRVGGESTTVRVHMINSRSVAEVTVETPGGSVVYEGETAIDGVPGTAAPVLCDFLDVAGSICGSLLPSARPADSIDGIDVTCIDNGMPVALLRAADLSLSGYESADELDANATLRERLEPIRLAAGRLMNLGDVAAATVPKMCLVAPPRDGGSISTRTFIPHVCHRSIGVLGAVTVATACLIPGSVAAGVADVPAGAEKHMRIEHPSGAFPVRLLVDETASPAEPVRRAGVVRTARLIMRGNAYVPAAVWTGGRERCG